MRVLVELTSQPIDPRCELPAELVGTVGAVVEFSGRVRAEEEGRAIAALEYEAYSPMAEQQMRRILEVLAGQQPCLFARVVHRVGVVPVGETAIHVSIAARHRAEAFAMLTGFMDRLKQDVPIWKCRALAGEESSIRTPQP
jgi:molybdopterin synthase catalytic subunit